eukprot:CAMPEP_0195529278 /NCGR_PEP_ID=MMETSP0794_2-20130614/31751_1 /TAXON_ID=515487 /ORGANISM="Stephanopyxis turris, Strain CCMP 815" /LENGTH=104 /DNA_ID=CAMNT_0040660559 /DNA_START=233 /DNA_END=547 /DNA_ORIENTATION=+
MMMMKEGENEDSKTTVSPKLPSSSSSHEERMARINNGGYDYTPPKFSPSFQAHMTSFTTATSTTEGVDCTGEPSIDPSRAAHNSGGMDSEWFEDVAFMSQLDEE